MYVGVIGETDMYLTPPMLTNTRKHYEICRYLEGSGLWVCLSFIMRQLHMYVCIDHTNNGR
jgi:hypothetical protein